MKNEYQISYRILKQWEKEGRYRGRRLVIFIIWCVLAGACVVLGSLSLYVAMYLYAFFFVWTALFCLYRAFIFPALITKRQYKILCQTYGKDTWIRTILFEEDVIVLKEEKTMMTYDYSDIVAIEENNDLVSLRLKAKTTIRVYKSRFTEGSWEDCRELIVRNNRALA